VPARGGRTAPVAERTLRFRAGEPGWDSWRERAPHDFYHDAAYHALAERSGEGTAHLLVHGDPEHFVAWPYLVRDIDHRHVDGYSVYGYSGPFGTGLSDPILLARAWDAFREAWAEQRLVTLFTRFHPLLGNALPCAGLRGPSVRAGGESLTVGRSVSIDLTLSPEARRGAYRKVLRQEIAAAKRAGLVVAEDHAWQHQARFAELYRETMSRNEASDRYRFDDAYLSGLREALGESAHLALARVGEEIVALMLFTVRGDIAQAHLTGSSERWRHLSPTKVLIDGVADLARTHGAAHLHLGAGRGGHEDSLFAFKRRFSPRLHDFVLGRWVLDPELDERLTASAHPDGHPDERYFPAYRAPPARDEP